MLLLVQLCFATASEQRAYELSTNLAQMGAEWFFTDVDLLEAAYAD